LRTYFGLTFDQVSDISANWNTLWAGTLQTYNANLPSPPEFQNTFGTAYWQWATGELTLANEGVESIALLGNNAFAGFNEISYFHSAYFNSQANAANVAYFSSVVLYNDYFSDLSSNFEHLFATFDSLPGSDPPANSLFDLTNM
jgi:hypothetical protein